MPSIRVLLIGLLVLGASIWLYARQMPAFVAGPVKTEADLRLHLLSASRANYYQQEGALRTSRNTWLDAGSGLAVTGAVLLLCVVVFRATTLAEVKRQPTPGKGGVLWWFNAGWVVLFGALYWYYSYHGGRGDYPPFADSILIPITRGAGLLLCLWPVMNGLLLLALWGAKLPAELGARPYQYSRRAILTEIVVALVALGLLVLGVDSIVHGSHLTIPVVLGYLYLLLVLRAGHMRAITQPQPEQA